MALNGPKTPFTWAVSFYVARRTQKEIDYYWSKLLAGGGEEQPCGCVKDKFGLSWPIIPTIVLGLLEDKDKKGRPGYASHAHDEKAEYCEAESSQEEPSNGGAALSPKRRMRKSQVRDKS